MRSDDVVSSIVPRAAGRAEARAKIDAERDAQARADAVARFGVDGALLADIFPGAGIASIGEVTADDLRADAERARSRMPDRMPDWWTDDTQVSHSDWINANIARPRYAPYCRHYASQPFQWSHLGPRVWRTMLHRNQWSWYCQQDVKGRRIPVGANEKVDPPDPANPDKVLNKLLGVSPRWLAEEAATPERTAEWVWNLDHKNRKRVQVAIPVGGAANLYISAVDSDLDFPDYAARVRRVVEGHLPPTPYVRGRHGSHRKAFLFRQDPADAWGKVSKLALRIPESVDPDAAPPKKQEVEFLCRPNQSITILGRHYHDEEVLEWEDLCPGLDEGATPFRAPVVSSAQFAAFHAALLAEFANDLAPVDRNGPRSSGVVVEYDGDAQDLAGLRLPAEPHYSGTYTRGEDGRVVSGREGWVFAHCGYVACLATNLGASPAALANLVADDLERHVVTAGWTDLTGIGVLEYIRKKMDAAVAYRDGRVRDHGFEGYRVARVGHVEVAATEDDYGSDEYADPDIRALVPRTVTTKNPDRRPDRRFRTPANPERAAARALLDDRSALTAGVSATITSGLRRHLDNVAGVQGLLDAPTPTRDRLRARRDAAAAHDAETERLRSEHKALLAAGTPANDPAAVDLIARIRASQSNAFDAAAKVTGKGTDWKSLARTVLVLKGPTGSGKTTSALAEILGMKARLAAQGKRLGTQLFFAPSHALLGEVAEKAEALLDAKAEAENLGLVVRIYQGRSQVCTHPAWPSLRAGGISGEKLCRSTKRVLVDGEWEDEDVECPARATCVFWTQRENLDTIDILFMPSAYLTLPIPAEVRAVATGVIADESIVSQFLAYAMMPISTLGDERRVPRINKREQEAGITEGHLINERREIADIVRPIVERGDDPALGLLAHDWGCPYGEAVPHLLQLLDSAVNTCGRAMDVHEEVSPDMNPADAGDLAALRATDKHLPEEKRFWSTVRERVLALVNDRALTGLGSTPAMKAVVDRLRTAKGDRDARIQTLRHEDDVPTVRVSYRRKNSFADLPTLLMDASADKGMIEKIYKGRPVEVVEAACPPHLQVLLVPDRSMSDTSLLPYRDRAPFAAAQTLVDIRTVIDGVSALFGHSRVAVASTLAVEMAANTAWRMPGNASWLHYNNVVGFDWAKFHPAMVVVGRQELPINVIDALVGALTYDDDRPEQPIDKLGTGLDAKGERVRAIAATRVQPMRDGSDLTIEDRTYAGAWARAVQSQAREEQVRQAIGRLRPVYREGLAPLLVYVGRALPADLVVDAVASLSDVVRSDACRLGRDLRVGGMVRYRSDMNGPAPSSAGTIPESGEGEHVVAMREGRHHGQRGLATVEVALTCGRTVEGFVPMADLNPEELRRRVDRHLGLCTPPRYRAPGSEVRVTRVPERDAVAIVRADDPRMVARLGDRLARQVAEDAADVLAERVCRVAKDLHGEAKARANRERRAAPDAGPEALATTEAMAAVLTVRKRPAGECAADLGTLVNIDLPEVLAPAFARAMEPERGSRSAAAAAREAVRVEWMARDVAERNGDVDESEPDVAEQDNVAAPAPTLADLYDEMAGLLDAA